MPSGQRSMPWDGRHSMPGAVVHISSASAASRLHRRRLHHYRTGALQMDTGNKCRGQVHALRAGQTIGCSHRRGSVCISDARSCPETAPSPMDSCGMPEVRAQAGDGSRHRGKAMGWGARKKKTTMCSCARKVKEEYNTRFTNNDHESGHPQPATHVRTAQVVGGSEAGGKGEGGRHQ